MSGAKGQSATVLTFRSKGDKAEYRLSNDLDKDAQCVCLVLWVR